MIGTRLGPYEVTGKLGEGGMGEVWRAIDSRLRREVAIKVLPPAFPADRERLARFEREAQTLAALNHANIAAIYGLEEADGVRALVMELVEGEDLSALIARGPLPVEEAIAVARQIAEALEAAHEQGIVHRDLKPANVKVRPDGTVKVLDFGLAKALEPMPTSGARADLAHSPTLTAAPGTQLGVILGTAAYMSPEQARGKAVDKRADVWAFGVVLYEMLVGARLFAGDEISDVLAAVLRQEVDLAGLPAATPASVGRLLARCLERDPRLRLRDIGEARIELGRVPAGDADPAPRGQARGFGGRQRLAWLAAGALATAVAFGVVALVRPSDPPASAARGVVRLPFVPPAGIVLDPGPSRDWAVLAPDGRKLVFLGRAEGGRRMLWLRELATNEARALPGSEDALDPFWSPDSRAVAFGSGGKLKRVDLDGGQAQTLADAPRLNGGSWGRSGVILYSPDFRAGLYRVPASGGEAVLASAPVRAYENARNYPCFLPDGRRFLFHVNINFAGGAKLMAGSLDSAEVVEVLPRVGYAAYAAPGWLVYERNGALMAQRFDPDALRLGGEAATIATGVESGFRGGRMSVSDAGVLLVQNPRPHDYQLVWFDRAGRRLGDAGPPRRVAIGMAPALSPDGSRVAIQLRDAETGNQDIWLVDVARSTADRLTIDPSLDQLPVWAPDGRSLLVTTSRGGKAGIYRIAADGGSEELITGEGVRFPLDVSADGRLLLFGERGTATRLDVWALPLDDAREPVALLRTPADEIRASLSPDGRFLAYDSDVTGRGEVYVRRFSVDGTLGEATRVSAGGGVNPRWRADGRELFFVEAPLTFDEAHLMAVDVVPGGDRLDLGTPRRLFPARMLVLSLSAEYDVSADGQRFLVGTVLEESEAPSAVLVLDWIAEVSR